LGFEAFIAGRYLRSPRKDRSISVITKIAVGGVAVGVMVLITALSMMNGMEKELRAALRGVESDLTVYSFSADGFHWTPDSQLIARIRKTVPIEAYAPFTSHQALIMGPKNPSGTLIRGIDSIKEAEVAPIRFFIRTESFEAKHNNTRPDQPIDEERFQEAQKILSRLSAYTVTVEDDAGRQRTHNESGIIIGSQLAHNLGVTIGDQVTIMSLETRMTPMGEIPRTKRFRVVGFFETGMAAYDELLSLIDIEVAQRIFRMEGKINGLTVRFADPNKAESYQERLRSEIGFPYFFTTWMDSNKNLFAMFKREKLGLAIILTLIILLASFLIVSSLIMLVVEKRKDIAILKAMGAKNRSIRKIFIYQGTLIGFTGTVAGVCLGLVACWALSRFDVIDVPPGVYVGNRIPMHIEPTQIALIAAVSLLICFLVTIIPSRKASGLNPVDGMRNE
jgi:lipoprotein-releasing system permease protein